ncbi:alpha/beta fold hydrolase [Marinicrinis lubricantis]|uniref:Alpha/beta fold hydrolase n=1 Tax=Marinicrinis lubricantis TaxID=2086470 RepID=A0ABW1IRQ5_9BACL
MVAVDIIGGSGRSEPNSNYYSQFSQVVWIDEVMDALQIQKAHICGVSYGAYLSYLYTLKRPDRVNKAVCLAGRIPSSQFEVMMKMMAAFLPEALFPSEKSCRRLLNKLTAPGSIVFQENEALMRHWYYLLKYFNNRSMMQHKIEIHPNHELKMLKKNTLFLIGEYDRLTNYKKAIHRLDENELNYTVIRDAGHAINHEQAAVINREIVGFLS